MRFLHAGGWTTSAAVALTSYTCRVSKWGVFLSYGVLFGFGVGLCYSAPFVCAMRWMPHRAGVVSGFVVAGFGGGSAVFNQVQTRFVNPDNLNRTLTPYPDLAPTEKYYSAEDVERVPEMFLLLAVGKSHFLRHLDLKTIILPRQARDKHRKNSKTSGVFS